MKRVLLYSSLFLCTFIAPIAVAHAEAEGANGKGILTGVLNKVESTVKETTESVGEVVESAVEGADQTVQDAVSFTKDTVETLADTSTEQPVSEIVDHTIDFVDGTVGNVGPVVENTTETIQATTLALTGIVEELPDIPIVTPVLDEVGKVVIEKTETVSVTVENVRDKEAAGSIEEVTEYKTPVLPQQDDAPPINAHSDEVIEQPVFDTNLDVQADDPISTIDSLEVLESTEPEIDEDMDFISNETPRETAVSFVNQVASVAKVERKTPAKQETPTIPIQSSTQEDGIPIGLTSGTTSVFSPLVTHGGNSDVVPGVVDGLAVLDYLIGRQWIHSDELMRILWVHAPPGQPPQSTPFLHAKK
ncbi:hypothetical protein AB1K89_08795 [Sporosarcina sp. 179-K 8C2 HS]|uniref:hypothetical protein n=1 Tax=Sporosarcina sp. 179-K 8C2 HS TaxID=3142387 RepID=UPI0039A19FDF